MRLRLANVRVVEKPRDLMPIAMVLDVLNDSACVAHAGVSQPGAFCVDFIERQVIPHLQRLQQLEAMR